MNRIRFFVWAAMMPLFLVVGSPGFAQSSQYLLIEAPQEAREEPPASDGLSNYFVAADALDYTLAGDQLSPDALECSAEGCNASGDVHPFCCNQLGCKCGCRQEEPQTYGEGAVVRGYVLKGGTWWKNGIGHRPVKHADGSVTYQKMRPAPVLAPLPMRMQATPQMQFVRPRLGGRIRACFGGS